MPLGIGAIVCVHNDGANIDTWIGIICGAIVDGHTVYRVKQLGRRQVTAFSFEPEELRETVVTFEGPMCVECRRPP